MTSAGVARPPVSLLDEALALAPRPGPRCRLALLRASDASLADEIEGALGKVSFESLAMALKNRDVDINAGILSHHARRKCRCP